MINHSELISDEVRDVARLVSMTNAFKERNWSYSGDIVASKSAFSITTNGSLTWDTNRGQCTLSSDMQRFGGHLLPNGSFGKLMPKSENVSLTDPVSSWRSNFATVISSWSGKQEETVKLALDSLEFGDRSIPADQSGFIVSDVAFEFYPTWFPLDNTNDEVARDGFVTTLYGRKAVLRKLRGTQDVIVVFDGTSLQDREQGVVALLLSFLSGRHGAVTSVFGYSDGQPTFVQHFAYQPQIAPAVPPIAWGLRPTSLSSFGSDFARMLTVLLGLIEEGIRFDVAVRHLLSSGRSGLETDLRDIALALDSVIESSAVSNGKHIYTQTSNFDKVAKILLEQLPELINTCKCSVELQLSLIRKIQSANDSSHADRRRAFWDRIGMTLPDNAKTALDYRHPMSHAGFILTAFEDSDLQELVTNIAVARTFVNRVLLKLLEYHGQVFDYETGHNKH